MINQGWYIRPLTIGHMIFAFKVAQLLLDGWRGGTYHSVPLLPQVRILLASSRALYPLASSRNIISFVKRSLPCASIDTYRHTFSIFTLMLQCLNSNFILINIMFRIANYFKFKEYAFLQGYSWLGLGPIWLLGCLLKAWFVDRVAPFFYH